MKIAVIVFPGSNCDIDLYEALKTVCGADVDYVDHQQTSLAGKPQRLLKQHRRDLQPGRQRLGDDAAPGTGGRSNLGQHRWPAGL